LLRVQRKLEKVVGALEQRNLTEHVSQIIIVAFGWIVDYFIAFS
jgi:hypothetical protein